MTKEIMEGNAKIAEFMGYTIYPEKHSNFKPASLSHIYKSDIKNYHSDWNELMPVAAKCYLIINEKVNELIGNDSDLDDLTGWRAWSHARFDLSTNIEKVYERVIQFIDWYNANLTVTSKD